MTEIFAIVAAVLAAAALVVGLLTLQSVRSGRAQNGAGGQPGAAGDAARLERLERLAERTAYISEQSAHAVRDYLDFLSKQQGGALAGLAEKMEALADATERRLAEIQRHWDAFCMLELTPEHISGKQTRT